MPRQYYQFDIWRDESIWSWAGEANNQEEAQEYALSELNSDWGEDHATWDDLAESMDGTALTVISIEEHRAKENAMAMLTVLRNYPAACESAAAYATSHGDPGLFNIWMQRARETHTILARIDKEA